MARYTKEDKQHALSQLQQYLRPVKRGSGEPLQVIYMMVRSVSRSGMQRTISTYAPDNRMPPELISLDWAIAVTCDLRLDRDRGVKIGGCGMDMCFALLDAAVSRAFDGETRYSANDFRIHHL